MGQQPGTLQTTDELVATTSPREVLHDEVHRSAAALMSTLGPAPAQATALCAEVAALLAIELVNVVDDQLADQVVTLTDAERLR